ncbi:MAG: hypothetical protein AAF039_10210 [Bacteroidota bacterium]
MKKNTLIWVLMVFLMVMNGLLLYLVLQKSDGQPRPPRAFIADELDFDNQQMTQFFDLEENHRRKMGDIDRRNGQLRETLFSYLEKSNPKESIIDSLGNYIGTLSKERELEIFRHFNAIEKICNEGQKRKLKRMVKGALRPGPPGGPPPHHSPGPPPK